MMVHAKMVVPTCRTLLILLAAAACGDRSEGPMAPSSPDLRLDPPRREAATVRWNRRATELLIQRPPSSNVPAIRMYTYLSLAQYRAVLAVEAAGHGEHRPSLPAAVGAASVEVLSAFFPLDQTTLADELAAETPDPSDAVAAGAALGRGVGAVVVALAAGDRVGATSPGVPPVGAGYWVSSSAPISRGLYGARPFFLTTTDQLRPAAPPAFGSPAYLKALARVRTLSDRRTPAQLAMALFWNQATAPFGPGFLNNVADDLIIKRRRSEREAARILAYANAAVFDAQIGCSDAKFAYWFIRPSQADPAITLPIGLPNHPSYPSAHSCITSSFLAVLVTAFPSERRRFDEMVRDAGLSRIYGGIHYQFDVDAGREIGRQAAALALRGGLE